MIDEIAREADLARFERFVKRASLGFTREVPPRYEWETRKPEEEPRHIDATPLDDGWQVKGRDMVKALKKAEGSGKRDSGSVLFLDCIIGITRLRQYFRVLSKDVLIIRAGKDSLTIEQAHHHTTIKHGAWDKYLGQNGYHARLTFRED